MKSWLALDTGVSNAVRLVKADKTLSGSPQLLSAGKACSFGAGGSGLLAISASPDRPGVGFATGAIGVREKSTSSGTSCAAVDWSGDAATTESLTLRLGTGVGSLVAMSASLDIDLKQNARILATATLSSDTSAPTGYFELQSGANIGEEPLVEGATVFTCNNPSDSGPDSGANNNCRWQISGPSWTKKTVLVNDVPTRVSSEDGVVFDTLKLEARAGSFSLMGGADGPVDDPMDPLPAYLGADDVGSTPDVSISSASIFELVEGSVACGETVKLSGTTVASSWNRIDNLGTSQCQPFPYSSRTGVDDDGRVFAEFTKPLDFETKAQALWTTTFVVGGGNSIPPITLELDRVNAEPLIYPALGACPAAYFSDPTSFDPPTDPYACLVSAVRGTGKLSKSVTYTAYVYGDATMRR